MDLQSLSDTLDRLEEVPLFDAERIPQDQRVIERRPDTVSALRQMLKESLDRGQAMLLFADGLPGSGKTGLARRLAQGSVSDGVISNAQIAELPLDYFIGTERGSPDRSRLTDDPEFFATHYVRYELVRKALAEALDAMTNQNNIGISLANAYDRDNGGKFKPHTFEVPKDTKLLIVEGAGSISQVAAYDGIPRSIVPASVWIGTSIREGLFRGTLRDILNGRGDRTFESLYESRVNEYRHLVPWAREAVRRATHICLRYPEEYSFADSLIRMQKDIEKGTRETARSVRDVMGQLDPEFLSLTFPGKIPKRLLPRKSDIVRATA